MNLSLYIAKRYLLSKSKNNAINIITAIASMGIIAGAMAMFVILSVFSGLREFSLAFTNEFDPDLKVETLKGKSFFISNEQKNQFNKIDGIANYSQIIEERVLFYFNGKENVTYLKGIDNQFTKTNKISQKLFNGKWLTPRTNEVVVGYGICDKLSMGLFDFNNPFEVFVPRPGKGVIENPENAFNKMVLVPMGIYAINEELDSKYVFCDIAIAQELLEFKPNQATGIEIKLKPNANEEEVKSAIKKIFNNTISVKNRAELNVTLHKMLNTENIAVYLILTLVIIIALFNLIGALIMMIIDKKSNLRTLISLGVEIKDLKRIFLLHGTALSVLGGILGILLGIIIVLLQKHFQLLMITDSLAYPVVFSFHNTILVIVTIVILGFISSWIASNRVSKKMLDYTN